MYCYIAATQWETPLEHVVMVSIHVMHFHIVAMHQLLVRLLIHD